MGIDNPNIGRFVLSRWAIDTAGVRKANRPSRGHRGGRHGGGYPPFEIAHLDTNLLFLLLGNPHPMFRHMAAGALLI